MNYSLIITSLILVLFFSNATQLGGWREVEVDLNANTEFSNRTVEVLTFAMDQMRDDKTIPKSHSFVNIVNLKTQVVAGTNWKLVLALRDFDKNLHHFEVVVWETLENSKNRFKLTAAKEITNQEEENHNQKRELVGGYSQFNCNLNAENDICGKLLAAAEPKLRLWGVLNEKEALGTIVEARRQIVAGTNFKIYVQVNNSDVAEKKVSLDFYQPLQNGIADQEEELEFVSFSVTGKNKLENTALGQYLNFFSAKVRDINDLISFIERDLPKKYPEYKNYTFQKIQDLRKKNVAANVYSFQAVFSEETSSKSANFAYSIFVYPPFVGHEMFKVENFQQLEVPAGRVLQEDFSEWAPVVVEYSSEETKNTIARLSEELALQDQIPSNIFLQLYGSFYRSQTSENRKVTLMFMDEKLSQSSKRVYEVIYQGHNLKNYIRKE